MNNKEIATKLWKLNSKELKELLKSLKLYLDLTKKLWNRWKTIFNNILSWKKSYKVEYSNLWKDTAWEEAINVFKKVFWVSPKEEEVSFLENKNILAWIKVFQDDNMVDISLKKAINQIK